MSLRTPIEYIAADYLAKLSPSDMESYSEQVELRKFQSLYEEYKCKIARWFDLGQFVRSNLLTAAEHREYEALSKELEFYRHRIKEMFQNPILCAMANREHKKQGYKNPLFRDMPVTQFPQEQPKAKHISQVADQPKSNLPSDFWRIDLGTLFQLLLWVAILIVSLLVDYHLSISTSTAPTSSYERWNEIGTMPTYEPLTAPTSGLTDHLNLDAGSSRAQITFVSYPRTAARNEEVTVRIKGAPNTRYTITVTYLSGISTADGLYAKTSNSEGYVSWTWKVGGRTTFGSYPITVSGGGDSETVYFTVE